MSWGFRDAVPPMGGYRQWKRVVMVLEAQRPESRGVQRRVPTGARGEGPSCPFQHLVAHTSLGLWPPRSCLSPQGLVPSLQMSCFLLQECLSLRVGPSGVIQDDLT